MIKHKTTIEIEEALFNIRYQDNILSMGSCFAQNIASFLAQNFYPISVNPFGTLYNPISIRNSLGLLLNNYEFQADDLFFHNGLWSSFQHHSSFSSPSPTTTLEQINIELIKARTRLQQSKVLILTFGTAWVYELRKNNKVVSNCHKMPANRFKRKRLSVAEIIESLGPLLEYLKEYLPELNIILTVSPIRHLKDGFVENQLSKSTLLLAVQEMVSRASFIHYFPAYEIMMDDLRDYRYYADDLVHPSKLAIQYIWEHFANHYLDPKELAIRNSIAKLQKAIQHRPFNPKSNGHQKFVLQQLKNIDKIQKKVPTLNLETAKQHFSEQLIT
ncbi:GSCFA domain-containing protein [Aureispira anguillae]|uniref:GSCFA domain-containing protein n=1 Tax=Aureispira anguillae TaxID=2864201 RepID=A0A916DUQ9_9BACT|nr:GSCFA domain-containing protein [Aureispira anguillae]BDS14334.1 GSCFA domain-containing protein [Aureispira anguillae]